MAWKKDYIADVQVQALNVVLRVLSERCSKSRSLHRFSPIRLSNNPSRARDQRTPCCCIGKMPEGMHPASLTTSRIANLTHLRTRYQ
jgi:hypothetical protein